MNVESKKLIKIEQEYKINILLELALLFGLILAVSSGSSESREISIHSCTFDQNLCGGALTNDVKRVQFNILYLLSGSSYKITDVTSISNLYFELIRIQFTLGFLFLS